MKHLILLFLIFSFSHSADLETLMDYPRNSGSGYAQDTWSLYNRHCDSGNCEISSNYYRLDPDTYRTTGYYWIIASNDGIYTIVFIDYHECLYNNSSGFYDCKNRSVRYNAKVNNCTSEQVFNTNNGHCDEKCFEDELRIRETGNCESLVYAISNCNQSFQNISPESTILGTSAISGMSKEMCTSCYTPPTPTINYKDSSGVTRNTRTIPRDFDYKTLGWSESNNACIAIYKRCKQGYAIQSAGFTPDCTKIDIKPIQDDDNQTKLDDDENYCAGRWVAGKSYDFCTDDGLINGTYDGESLGYANNTYNIEYECSTNYLKTYTYTSLCSTFNEQSNEIEYEESSSEPQEVSVTLADNSNLEPIDPTKSSLKNYEGLSSIERAISENLSPKIETTNENIEDLETTLEVTNDKIGDTNTKLDVANTNLVTISDGIAESNENIEDLETTLEVTNDKIGDTNTKLDTANNKLETIETSIGTTNSLIGTLSSNISEDFEGVDTNNLDTSSLDDDNSLLDNMGNNFNDLTSGIVGIGSDFDTIINMLDGQGLNIAIPQGSCSNTHMNKLSSYISPYSSIFALIIYVSFMIKIFNMIFQYMRSNK